MSFAAARSHLNLTNLVGRIPKLFICLNVDLIAALGEGEIVDILPSHVGTKRVHCLTKIDIECLDAIAVKDYLFCNLQHLFIHPLVNSRRGGRVLCEIGEDPEFSVGIDRNRNDCNEQVDKRFIFWQPKVESNSFK